MSCLIIIQYAETFICYIVTYYETYIYIQRMCLNLTECFLQISGTAIGIKMAQAYANIAMSIFERNLLKVHVTSH